MCLLHAAAAAGLTGASAAAAGGISSAASTSFLTGASTTGVEPGKGGTASETGACSAMAACIVQHGVVSRSSDEFSLCPKTR